MVEEGEVKDSEINIIFNKIKAKTYDEGEAKIMIKNIVLASFNIHSKRTDYQTPTKEALIHLGKFIKMKGSTNYKNNICITSLCNYYI